MNKHQSGDQQAWLPTRFVCDDDSSLAYGLLRGQNVTLLADITQDTTKAIRALIDDSRGMDPKLGALLRPHPHGGHLPFTITVKLDPNGPTAKMIEEALKNKSKKPRKPSGDDKG